MTWARLQRDKLELNMGRQTAVALSEDDERGFLLFLRADADTTCGGVEIKNLRWQDIDLFGRVSTIRRSRTAAGHRTIPLNADAMAAVARILEPAQALGSSEPEHSVCVCL